MISEFVHKVTLLKTHSLYLLYISLYLIHYISSLPSTWITLLLAGTFQKGKKWEKPWTAGSGSSLGRLPFFFSPWLPLGFHRNSPVLLKGSRCPWKEGVFCIPGRSVLICQLGSMGWFPANLLYSFLREGYWNLWLWLWIYFFFQLYQLCFLYFEPLVLGA